MSCGSASERNSIFLLFLGLFSRFLSRPLVVVVVVAGMVIIFLH